MTDTAQPKKRGRPPKPAEERRGHNLTFRTRADFRERLEQAAARSGRSVTEEVELRIERSFEVDHLIRSLDNLCSVFVDNGDLAREFATHVMATIASAQDYVSPDGRQVGSRDWATSLPTRLAIRDGIQILLDHYAPEAVPEDFEGLSQQDVNDIKQSRGLSKIGAKMATGQADDLVRLVMRQDAAP